MVLLAGQSELDSVRIRLLDPDLEIDNFDQFQYNQNFLVPTAGWNFVLSVAEPNQIEDTNALFTQGRKLQILIDDKLQCTGFIEHVDKKQSRTGGTEFTVSGRDVMGPVVTGCIDPQIKFNANQTVLDFVATVLNPYGIDTVFTTDDLNVNIITGIPVNAKTTKSKSNFSAEKNREYNDNGELINIVKTTGSVTQIAGFGRPDLKTIKLDVLKPNIGEGAYQILDRILTRLGLRLWASAEGAAVIDQPNFKFAPQQKLFRKFTGNQSNILDGAVSIDSKLQPACIVCQGSSIGGDGSTVTLRVIAINELVAIERIINLDSPNNTDEFNPIRFVNNILAQYPGAKVLPIRKSLVPYASLSKFYLQKPYFYKDDESRNLAQLSDYARKQLSLKQRDYLTAEYTVEGFSQNGFVYGINTIVSVDDDYCDLHRDMWVIEKTFTKSRGGGTQTKLKLIVPYTLELGAT